MDAWIPESLKSVEGGLARDLDLQLQLAGSIRTAHVRTCVATIAQLTSYS